MVDPAADTTSTESGAATVSKQVSTMALQDDDDVEANVVATRERQDLVSSVNEQSTPPSNIYANAGDKAAPPHRRPLFSSMREALESAGQVKEEPGGYVIKRRSSSSHHQQQQLRSGESAGLSKNRHPKQRASKASGDVSATAEDKADAAGYTIIRRRLSCDETLESSSASASFAAPSHSARRNPRASTQARAKKQQRPRRGSMSALQQSSSSSSLLASTAPPPPSVPPGFQPRAASRVLRPPPGLTSAASGWVVKAAAPAVNANKIAEPPVEALWPEMKATAKTDSGWATATTESLQAQAWPASASSNASAVADDQKIEEDDDLLARLGVTL